MNDEPRFELILGRPLAENERGEFPDVDALPSQAIGVARALAKSSKPLAVMYLRALVPSVNVASSMTRIAAKDHQLLAVHDRIRAREQEVGFDRLSRADQGFLAIWMLEAELNNDGALDHEHVGQRDESIARRLDDGPENLLGGIAGRKHRPGGRYMNSLLSSFRASPVQHMVAIGVATAWMRWLLRRMATRATDGQGRRALINSRTLAVWRALSSRVSSC